MTFYSIKGTIMFWVIVGSIIIAIISGNLIEAGSLIIYLIIGMVLYQIGRFSVRLITGFDPSNGTTRQLRRELKETSEQKEALETYVTQLNRIKELDMEDDAQSIQKTTELRDEMGFLSGIFNPNHEVENRLISVYTEMSVAEGMSRYDAEKMWKENMEKLKQEAKNEKTDTLPANYGDKLLELEKTASQYREFFAWKRDIGVTDDDIRSWWNLHDLERRLIVFSNDTERFKHFVAVVKNGNSPDQAGQEVMKKHPMYTSEKPGEDVPDQDKKLPYELTDRINSYYETLLESGDIQKYKTELSMFSSCNAYLRNKLNLSK
ncbi:MAG: hypothetical protein SCL54_10525 [Bacillota bacterium]|nr:hypothetical protein [Bacillota bacterium]